MNIAVKQLDGFLSDPHRQHAPRDPHNTLAQVEVNIDYPEYDDVEEATTGSVRRPLEFEAPTTPHIARR